MAISLDKAFGIHPDALALRMKRSEVLSSNIANADTPGYKAKDFDFQAALSGAKKQYTSSMTRTHEKHMSVTSSIDSSLQFRTPSQPDTGDGNTVELQQERMEFLKNQLGYNASIQFLTGRIKGIKNALKGGQG
ncbi:flagellar basal body rod protein FlgB [Saccharobesus litoralis]|uniref:Flagellar basal body rod protein FlgB n=1 Tax=Saccharobesus litoralis TaxID=2172099 RepID=A0A2S0VUQ6_9ALTE|nr:flagellar basal body rod protein FlgB [Saccharobesus litoralis]AWB67957.1 flagellar basal body rod protein FlgB [Saccharobesus litoralis]